jgi:hypothetical protein
VKHFLSLATIWLLIPLRALAVSTVTDVTPANVTALSVRFRVEHVPSGDGMVLFTVSVTPESRGVSDVCEGHFQLYAEAIQARAGTIFSVAIPVIMIARSGGS